MEYTVRIHACDTVTQATIQDFFRNQDGAYFVVYETDATRDHFQGWYKGDIKENTLRERIKKALSVKGNKMVSVTKCKDTRKYQRYLCKGTQTTLPHLVSSHGIEMTPEWVQEMHDEYWQQQQHAQVRTSLTVAQEAIAYAEQFQTERPPDVLEISTFLVNRCIQRHKPFDPYQLRRIKNLVMAKYDPHYADRMIMEIAQ